MLCTAQCVKIIADGEGFPVPSINDAHCTDCGLCASRCPEQNGPIRPQHDYIRVLGVKNKNETLLVKSASGGVFSSIAVDILKTPGNAVFGCAFDDNFVARHICAADISGLAIMQGSKYVQSDVGDTYLQTKNLLENSAAVLYSGAPCQIAGLYAFLGRDYDNLFTVDFVCHGVPSPLLFKRYIEWLGKKMGGTITEYNFRDKTTHGWGLIAYAKTLKNNKTIFPQLDPFYMTFLDNSTLRECCYNCRYANARRVSDITIGDFWGVERAHSDFYDKKGVSVVIVNTKKGDLLFSQLKNNFHIIETTIENIVPRNSNLIKPSPRPAQRDSIYNGINDAAHFFDKPVFKIKWTAYVKINAKAYIKRLTPAAALNLYHTFKNKRRTGGK